METRSAKKKQNKKQSTENENTPVRSSKRPKTLSTEIEDVKMTPIKNTSIKLNIKLLNITSPSKNEKVKTPVKSTKKSSSENESINCRAIRSTTKTKTSPDKPPIKIKIKNNQVVISRQTNSIEKEESKKKKEETEMDGKTEIKLNIYQKYKQALSGTLKSELVFRDNEITEIQNFIEIHLKSKKSSNVYISGPPGTGKSASTNAVLDKLEKKFKFEKLLLNCMSFATPMSLYKKIFQDLTGKCAESKDLIPLIVSELSKSNRKMVILVLDEIDILNSRHQEMLYAIFSLSMYKSTKVVVVGIANTLDFTVKTLTRFHSLNMDKMKEITFQPYDRDKLTGILKNRIQTLFSEPLFQDAAIVFCASKVSGYSGDARKALEILRRSIELVEQEVAKLNEQNNQVKMVTIQHVMKIVNHVYMDKMTELTDDDYNFPIQQKIVLCVILLLCKEGNKNLELGKCYDRFLKIVKEKSLKLEISSVNIFMDMCELLELKSLISIQKAKDLRCTKLSLLISQEEARNLLKTNIVLCSILT